MMFLLRVALALALVFLFLPISQGERSASEANIGPSEAFVAAHAAFADAGQFCSRQPDACAVGSHAALVIGQKAQAVAKMAFDYLSARIVQDADPAVPGRSRTFPGNMEAEKARSTLTDMDRALPWRGPPARTASNPKQSS